MGYDIERRTAGIHSTEYLMDLGAFSISLAVKDIAASREFYEKSGFKVFGGEQSHHRLTCAPLPN